jgi:hypothetical protein
VALAAKGHRVTAVEPVADLRRAAQHLHPSSRITWIEDSLPDLTVLCETGAKLARAGENRIRADGHRFTYLLTALFNARGRAFYERNGWILARFTQHRVFHFRRCVYVKRL